MNDALERILVMGVGNPLMRDDGIGPRVIEFLRSSFSFPDNVEVVDAGSMSFMILDLFRDIDQLIIIDAIQGTEHPAGTVLILTPEEIAPNQVKHSLHDTRLVDILQAAELMGHTPQTVAIGVQIEAIEDWVLELSPACDAAVPIAAAAVLDLLKALSVIPTPDKSADVDADIIAALRSYRPMPNGDPDA